MTKKLESLRNLASITNAAANYVMLCGFAILGKDFFSANTSTVLNTVRENKITTINSMWVIPMAIYFVPASLKSANPSVAIRIQEYLYGKDAYDAYTAHGLRQANSMLKLSAFATPCILAQYFGYAFPTFKEVINEVCKLTSPKAASLFSIAAGVSISSLVLRSIINKLNESKNKSTENRL